MSLQEDPNTRKPENEQLAREPENDAEREQTVFDPSERKKEKNAAREARKEASVLAAQEKAAAKAERKAEKNAAREARKVASVQAAEEKAAAKAEKKAEQNAAREARKEAAVLAAQERAAAKVKKSAERAAKAEEAAETETAKIEALVAEAAETETAEVETLVAEAAEPEAAEVETPAEEAAEPEAAEVEAPAEEAAEPEAAENEAPAEEAIAAAAVETETKKKKKAKKKKAEEKKPGFYGEYLEPIFLAVAHASAAAVKGVGRGLGAVILFLLRLIAPGLRRIFRAVGRFFVRFLRAVAAPFLKIRRGLHLIRRNYGRVRAEKGRLAGLREAGRTFREGVSNNRRLFVRALNYVLPVAMVAVLVTVVTAAQGLTFAVGVNYNGENIGYIENEATFVQAEQLMQQRIVYEEGDDTIDILPQYSLSLVNKGDILSSYQLADNMISQSNLEITRAKGVYIGSRFFGAVEDTAALERTLEDLLDRYRTDGVEEVEFETPITYRDGLYLASSMVEEKELIDLFGSERQQEKTYTAKKGDTAYSIAQENELSLGALYAMNPELVDGCREGTEVLLARSIPYLSVKASRTETFEEEIPFETVEVQDAKYFKGERIVTQQGKKGLRQVTAFVSYVNGEEVDREVLSSEVIEEAVDRRIAVGTAKPIQVSPGKSITGSGTFINPCPAGYVSQEYGHAGHKGLDIAAPYGSTIYASADGTVTLSKWYTGYGKCVMINHGNGVVSVYGHASSLFVSAGQIVKKGQPIAAVGATGYAFGNHVHFEIRVNGQKTNPRRYL